MDIPKLLSFIFGYFLFSAIIAPKQRIYPRRQTQLTYYRCALLYIYHRNDEPPGTAYVAIPGGSIGRLNRYNPFRPYQNNFICVSVNTATTASTLRSQLSNVANFPGLGSVGNVVGCAASVLPFPPNLLPLFFGIFDLRGFCFVCHISNHLNN